MTKTKIVALAMLTLSVTACMQTPKGEKALTGDIYSVDEIKGNEFMADLENSSIEWLGTKPTGTHWGKVKLNDGVVYVSKNKVVGGKMTIDFNTIAVLDIEDPDLNGRLLGHLKSADFFNVDSFPSATFQIAALEELDKNAQPIDGIFPTHTVKGNLTMRGITKGISFPARLEVDDSKVKVLTPQFFINRTQWNVNYGSKSIFANLKDNFINDEMGIKISFQAEKK